MSKNAVTLGQELVRMRSRKGISQFDLAICMAWKGTNPVIQIEKDRRIPKPETLSKIGRCLGLNYLEINYLNGLAGYVLPTRLPPKDYVIDTLNHIAAAIQEYPYPAYLVDYQFRIWLANRATAMFTAGDIDHLRQLMAKPLTTFDFIFDSRVGMCQNIDDLRYIQIDQVFRFKATNSFRQHEPFFREFAGRMGDLEADDYRAFLAAWEAIDANSVSIYQPVGIETYYTLLKQGDIRLRFPEGSVAFHLRVDSVLHLRDLFSGVMFIPVADPDNQRLAERVHKKYVPETGDAIKLWALIDVDPFFE